MQKHLWDRAEGEQENCKGALHLSGWGSCSIAKAWEWKKAIKARL